MSASFLRSVITLTAAGLILQSFAWSAPPDRIRQVRGNRYVSLSNSVHPRVRTAVDQGTLDPATMLSGLRLVLKPSAAQQNALEQLLEEQRDASSPNFQRWLTPEQYGDLFGASANDIAALTAWLQTQGFAIQESARADNWISFSGTASSLAMAFRTELHQYQSGTERHFANATVISIPEAFTDVVDTIRGMDDFRPNPLGKVKGRPNFTSASSSHYLAPDDLAAIYNLATLYAAGYDGTGQRLAVVGQTDINLSDIRAFRSQFGLPASDPKLVLTGPDPGIRSGDQIEADLDLEWSGAVARHAAIYYVYSQNVFESVQYAIDKNIAPVITMSYGSCEMGSPSTYRTMAQQANAQGITWLNSSGDSGAAGCDYNSLVATGGPAVTFPADIPEVTAVGGTEFNETAGAGWASRNSSTFESATGYLPEKAWNDSASGGGISASGGGASILFRKPWWQSGAGVPNDNNRDVPDVALSASAEHDGYLIYANGSLMSVGGTSASSPAFAGIVTILNQFLLMKGVQANAGLGNINPNLYSLAQASNGIFHDITVGDNIVPCRTGTTGCTTGSFGYHAGPGYDLVTGLGSVDAYNLITKWASLPPAVGTTMTAVSNPSTIAQAASTQLTAIVKAVTGTNAPTGTVSFASGGVVLGSAAVVAGSAAIAVKGTTLNPGVNVLQVTYTASGSFANATAAVTVTVTVPLIATTTVLSANPMSITTGGSAVLAATVKPASGSTVPTGTLMFSLGSKTLGTAVLNSAGTASLTVSAATLSAGNNSVTATYAGNSYFSPSTSGAAIVTVTVPAVATTAHLTATPVTIAQSASTTLTATVRPATGSAVLAGVINFSSGANALGSVTLTPVAGVATATLNVNGSTLSVGLDTITASYVGASGFTASSASLTVSVTAPPASTTTTVTATPATIASSGTTQLTATVHNASGSATPPGSVTFTVGAVSLGNVLLSGGTAVLTVKGATLLSGANTITATYSAATGFTGSSGKVVVTVTPAPAASSAVGFTALKGTSTQPGFPVTLRLVEQSGVASTLTAITINGTDFSSAIAPLFGSKQIPALGALSAQLVVQWVPLPANLTFIVTGTDANGRQWVQTAAIATGK